METRQDRLDAALAEALRMTAELSNTTGLVNGYLATPAEIASHIVARTVAARRGKVKTAVWRLYGKADDIAKALRPLTTPNAAPQSVSGQGTGIGWSLSDGFLHVADEMYRLSAAVPGIHRRLPEVDADDGALTLTFRRHLASAGLGDAIVDGASVATSTAAGGAWTQFRVAMPDDRLSHVNEIENAAHLPCSRIDAALAHLAAMAAKVRDNAARLSRLADAVEASAAERVAPLADMGMTAGRPRLSQIANDRNRRIDDLVTMQVPVGTLTPGLQPITMTAHFHCPLGLIHPTEDTMNHLIERHIQRAGWVRRHGGLRIERTGIAVLEARGCDVDGMVAKARSAMFEMTPRGVSSYVRIDQGRLFATAPLSKDVTWRRDLIDIPGTLPETVMAALPGRPARSVVDHPALEGAVISRCVRKGRRTHIHIEPRWETMP